MKKHRIEDFLGGWIVGDFSPSIFRNPYLEVSVKRFNSGDSELAHSQIVATELTVVVSGKVVLNGQLLVTGDILEISPGEVGSFECIEAADIVCIKWPSIPSDKVLAK
jgi:hypothetical protein